MIYKRLLFSHTEGISENILSQSRISKNGNTYNPFNYAFYFALSNLETAKLIKRPSKGKIELTEKGYNFSGNEISLAQYVSQMVASKSQKNSLNNNEFEEDEFWRNDILKSLNDLSSTKFEYFCRALMKKMNIDVDTEKGISPVDDGGIDGFGYLTTDDFRTTRVAVQAKKWTKGLVSSPEIDKFRGAMDKFRAEYGIFITTSSFTRGAIKTSRNGTHIITLIDGDKLIDLMIKYQFCVKPVTKYIFDDIFNKN